ncbi:MAG TPA: family 16 glycoside hydrolase [Thermoanaerobaculaceae bacterium]|nr:family 16 glycoside hydrolase [Thermoanaerobaculaceae bacterium]
MSLEAQDAIVTGVSSRFGRPVTADLTAAGIVGVGPVLCVDTGRLCHNVRVNFERAVRMTHAALGHFLRARNGHLLNTSSPTIRGRHNLGCGVVMRRFTGLLLVTAVAGCSHRRPSVGWVTLIDGGNGLGNFDQIGDANWRSEGGAIVADRGRGGHLVSKGSYRDFELYAEFWADHTTNSGIFIRATDPRNLRADNAYEVQIFDQRPGPEYATGAIVNFAKLPAPRRYEAGGKWNTLEIHAKNNEVTVKLNGEVTVHLVNGKFASGPFALQFGQGPGNVQGGAIKWRRVEVRPL